ncbi:hypothetical protein COD09_07190 [Bacillus cereus]|uniref:Uncharacterized protein n=1 Tax=Bacillus cereus TaxID=1396 RepID=A0A2C1DE47_BACCE|nr:hypothetical protein COD09_07190 [Bacillus cereus]
MKLMNSYKLVSFNVVVFMTYKRCHTFTARFTNLCYLKTYELKALDCRLKAMGAFSYD